MIVTQDITTRWKYIRIIIYTFANVKIKIYTWEIGIFTVDSIDMHIAHL